MRLPSESKLSNQAPDSSACKIKGNISKNGQRIYHLPGQENYDETVISPERGERFFCSWLTLAVTSSAAIKSARYRAHLPGFILPAPFDVMKVQAEAAPPIPRTESEPLGRGWLGRNSPKGVPPPCKPGFARGAMAKAR